MIYKSKREETVILQPGNNLQVSEKETKNKNMQSENNTTLKLITLIHL